MPALFYIGIILALLSFIPWVMLNAKMMRSRKEYGQMPLKMKEIEAEYRKKRFYVMLLQLAGIAIAIIGCAV